MSVPESWINSDGNWTLDNPYTMPSSHRTADYPPNITASGIRERIPDLEAKTSASVRNIVNAVGILERYLWEKFRESRGIENIPAKELDTYLADFFPKLKKPLGGEYDPASLVKLRSYLERFLREKNYPYSIGKSREFLESQVAFQAKRIQVQTQTARSL